MSLRIGLVYDRFGDTPPPPDAPPDWDAEFEPEETVAALEAAVRALGHEPVRIGSAQALLRRIGEGTLDPSTPSTGSGTGPSTELPSTSSGRAGTGPSTELRDRGSGRGIDAAVNIAESYGSRNREAHAPVLLELAGIPCLGSDALTLSLSLDKAWTKDLARAAGVPTPEYRVLRRAADLDETDLPPFPLIVKPRYEGTAKGIAPSSRAETPDGVRREVERQTRLYGQDVIVERFVEGGEFTVAVVGNDPPRVLPVLQRATERHSGIGLHALERHEDPDAPFAYDLDGTLDEVLEMRLRDLALRVYRKLECKDFARADFRVDALGKPWFIEINPLPTFAPDGTFAIIAELMNQPYPDLLAELIAGGLRRLGLG